MYPVSMGGSVYTVQLNAIEGEERLGVNGRRRGERVVERKKLG